MAKDPLYKNFKCPTVGLTSKYALPEDDGFLEGEDLSVELPKYQDQGQKRGRKPKPGGEAKPGKKSTCKKRGGKKGQKNNGKKGLQGRRKAKVERVKRAVSKSTPEPPAAPKARVVKKRKSRTKKSKTAPAEPPIAKPNEPITQEVGFAVPDDAVAAPPTIKGNSIYSSASRKAEKLGGAIEEWRQQGQHASWLFRTHKMISPSLSGLPRQPKTPKTVPSEPGIES